MMGGMMLAGSQVSETNATCTSVGLDQVSGPDMGLRQSTSLNSLDSCLWGFYRLGGRSK